MNSMKLCFLMIKLQSLMSIVNIFVYCQLNARQSETYLTYFANQAVDNDVGTLSIAVPDRNGYTWWQVDLGNIYNIVNVIIINSNVVEDIKDIFVTLSIENTLNYFSDKWSENTYLIPKNGILDMNTRFSTSSSPFGRHLTIWKIKPVDPNERNVVILAEVRIYGNLLTKNVSTSSTTANTATTITRTTTSAKATNTPILIEQISVKIAELKSENEELRMEKENMMKLAIGISVGVGLFLIIIALIISIIIGRKCASQKPGPTKQNIGYDTTFEYAGQISGASIENNEYDTVKEGDEIYKYSHLKKKNESNEKNEKNEPAYIDII